MTSRIKQNLLPQLNRRTIATAKECTWLAKIASKTLHDDLHA
jgi:hypothetical protein